jgi:hypothetical protein
MKRRAFALLTLAAAAVASLLIPFAASADGSRQLVIGARFDLATGTGTFSACCAVNDTGSAALEITSFITHGDRAVFEATNTFNGSHGTFTIAIDGSTGPLAIDGVENPRHIARGRWTIVAGTGDYVGLRGHGSLSAMSDFVAGTLTAIDEGVASRGR